MKKTYLRGSYGILAAVDWPPAVKVQAITEGLYVARIHDDVFDLG
jgi:hypothetical protein